MQLSDDVFEVTGSEQEHFVTAVELAVTMADVVVKAIRFSDGAASLHGGYIAEHEQEGMLFVPKFSSEVYELMLWEWVTSSDATGAFKAKHPAPRSDGTVKLGWRVTRTPQDRVEHSSGLVVAATPAWRVYGK